MKKEVKQLMKEVVNAKDVNEINLIKSKLSVYFMVESQETRKRDLKIKEEELALKSKEFDFKREQSSKELAMKQADLDLKRVQNAEDMNIKKKELDLRIEENELKKGQMISNAKSAIVSSIVTVALTMAKLGAFSALSLFMHKRENVDYEKESTFSKELRQGLLK